MKALIYTKIGGPETLKIMEVPKPTPNRNQVLIKVKACALNIADYERFKTLTDEVPLSMRAMSIVMGLKGKPLGGEVSGIVTEVGDSVKHVKIGDEVYGQTTGAVSSGGMAEYALLDEKRVFRKPSNLSFEESSAICISFETALGAVRKTNISLGKEVMVYGASGGVGLFVVQIAKALGATVTGVCSTRNVSLAKSVGCDYIIDYKTEDFRQINKKYDAILGINGYNPMKEYKKLLKPNGIFVAVGNAKQGMAGFVASITSRQITYHANPISPQRDYLSYGKKLAEEGKLKPYIDRVYSVNDIGQAITYVVKEHAQGKVVIQTDFSE